jgi:Trk K+ transport system NAD-binding subunit
MAQLLVNPNLVNFFEILGSRDMEFDIAQITVGEGTAYRDRTLAEVDFRERGINVVAIRKAGGEFFVLPPSNSRLEANDVLMVLGDEAAIEDFIARDA